MSEWRLFEPGTIPYPSTAEFHAERERAPHLEQDDQRDRLLTAARFTLEALTAQEQRDPLTRITFSDLGCGDGGLLSLVQARFAAAWGYDFCPANAAGWTERGVTGHQLDVFGSGRGEVQIGTVCAVTEVLEHLADPHGELMWMRERATWLVCSSPSNESDQSHDPCHCWAWDMNGYAAMVEAAGWKLVRHKAEGPGRFQVVLAT